MTTLAEAAYWYARRGLHVIPARGKIPLTPHGCLDATTDPAVIAAWWARWPSAGVGIACRPSGLLVVDIDPRNHGDDSFHELERLHGPLPDTWTSRTGGGGEHRFFQRPAAELADRPIAPGVDIKTNGYIVAPPSLHPSGRRYEWLTGFAPEDLPLAACPDWLVGLITAPNGTRLRFDGTPLTIRDGARNATLMRLGAVLRRYGLSAAAIAGSLRAISREHCKPPLDDAEVQRIAASVARYAPAVRP